MLERQTHKENYHKKKKIINKNVPSGHENIITALQQLLRTTGMRLSSFRCKECEIRRTLWWTGDQMNYLLSSAIVFLS